MRFIYFIFAVLVFHTGETYASDKKHDKKPDKPDKKPDKKTAQVLDKLEEAFANITERIGNNEGKLDLLVGIANEVELINGKLDGLVDSISKLESCFECSRPKVMDGYFEGTSTQVGDVLLLHCYEGYDLDYYRDGKNKVECLPGGTWTTIPECFKTCSSPKVQNSVQFSEDNTYMYNTEITIECQTGSIYAGERLRCNGESGWIGNASCTPIECSSTPERKFGTYAQESGTYNDTISIQCDEGYQKAGSNFIRCNAVGGWDGSQGCLKRIIIGRLTNEDGTTASFLKQADTKYETRKKNVLGSTYTDNQIPCLSFCFVNFPQFSYVTHYESECDCIQNPNPAFTYSKVDQHTYFRESESGLSAYIP